jgi:cytochrome c-type biogenesis protein CcmH/NrfG
MKQSENQLRDELLLRQASLEDARRELEAGELTPIQAATIEAREELALMRIRRELDDLASGSGAKRQGRQRRTSLLVVGLVCLLTVLVIVLWHSLSLRQAGSQDTGSITLSRSQEVTQYLTAAQQDIASANVSAALQAYEYVLELAPTNVEALTETGWLDFSAGSSAVNPSLVSIGETDLTDAIRYGPKNAAARLYYAMAADSTPGNQKVAKAQFTVFLALHPSPAQLEVARKDLLALGLPTS